MSKNLFLQTKSLTKKFGDVIAVNEVDMDIYCGEIRGLIGENGSGKSTISQMISGIYSITSGEIYIHNKLYHPTSNLDATNMKISMIVQEQGTIDELSIAENLFLGQEKKFVKYGTLNKRKMEQEATNILKLVGLESLNVSVPISFYSFETRKLVEIAKALSIDPELFIVDETTTALSHEGRLKIHQIMKELKSKGKAVLFISHDLEELMEICDTLTVLRDGKLIKNIDSSEFDEVMIKNTMVGRQIVGDYYRSDFDPSCKDKVMLKIENVSTNTLSNVTFDLHEGEIIGFGGLSQCGMHELAKTIFGMEKIKSGKIIAKGRRQLTKKEKFNYSKAKLLKKQFEFPSDEVEYEIKNIETALKASIGYISKDRDKETLILPASIRNNLVISNLDQLAVYGIITNKSAKKFANDMKTEFRIKCSSIEQLVSELSGGNKQKISFAKWIGNNSRILIFDSPTRGVDVGVKQTMYQLLNELKKKGYSIIIVSEEIPELIGMSDRIFILKDGKISHEFTRSESLSESDIIQFMI